MQKLMVQLEEACRLRRPLFFLGEPGTGKQFLARVAHDMTHRGLFLVLDAAASELEEARAVLSAWTGRQTTIYVREAWANPPLVTEVLEQAQGQPTLRVCLGSRAQASDPLLTQLRPVMGKTTWIRVPPLGERRTDLPELVSEFLTEPDGRARALTPRAIELLAHHHWPSNVSELKRVCWQLALRYPEARTIDRPEVERILAASDRWLDEFSFDQLVRAKLARFLQRVSGYEMSRLRQEVLDEVDRHLLDLALAATRWNKLKAARLLGISRNTLRKRLRDLGLHPAS